MPVSKAAELVCRISIDPGTERTGCTDPGLLVARYFQQLPGCEAESGLASYYSGRGHRGEMTQLMHPASRKRVVVSRAGRSISCRINDRGPFILGRVIDVSISAARALGMIGPGVARVSVQ